MSDRHFMDVNSLAQWLHRDDETISLVMRPENDNARCKQQHKASKMKDGDLLLSFIKGVCCWAGILEVKTNEAKGHKQPLNPVDSDDPWRCHFGLALDVEPITKLATPEQCYYTTNDQLGLKYQGRNIYMQMQQQDDCKHTKDRIRSLAQRTPESIRANASPEETRQLDEFANLWTTTRERDSYLTQVEIIRSGGKCRICGTTAEEWVARVRQSEQGKHCLDVFTGPNGYMFLQGHHQNPRAYGGDARLGNLLALCPNCHQVIGRNLDAKRRDRNQT